MKRRFLLRGALVLAFCGIAKGAPTRGGIPIPVIWGSGEKMTELGDLPPEVSSSVAEELGTQVTVAFLHERAHLFYLDLWTWNGRYVVHSGDQYWEMDPAGWISLIGAEPSDIYGKPIWYRIPSLLALLTVVLAGFAVRICLFKTDGEKLEALMNDERYQRSLETIFGKTNGEEPTSAITVLDEQRFIDGKNQLIGEGVAAHTAESNLRKIASAIVSDANTQLDAYFELASSLEQQDELDKSAEVYALVLAALPDDDERIVHVRDCLAAVNEKRTPNDTESGPRD